MRVSDELTFTLFSVGDSDPNNASCLLHIRGDGLNVLLTGDIESRAEFRLLDFDLPTMDVISMPHHGSNSSSTPALLNKLRPNLAIVSAGRNNRFHHPNPLIVKRYIRRHIRVIDTATSGAINVVFNDDVMDIYLARERYPRFWY